MDKHQAWASNLDHVANLGDEDLARGASTTGILFSYILVWDILMSSVFIHMKASTGCISRDGLSAVDKVASDRKHKVFSLTATSKQQ